MSVLNKIAYFQNRRDEVPNQEVARELAQTRNRDDIRELAENLWNKEANIASDCLKALYELGYLAPDLVADYADDFVKLLKHRNNRMVWGGMIALSTVASLRADALFPHVDEIKKTMAAGTVITNDAGMKTLCAIAAHQDEYSQSLLPYLFERLANARPVDAPRYAEFIVEAVSPREQEQFMAILEKWLLSAPAARQARFKKVLKQAGKIA